jgi:hypothetical protein
MKLGFVSCLSLIILATFVLVPPALTQQQPQLATPKVPQACVLQKRTKPCVIEGKPGLQMQTCQKNGWTDVGGCVPLLTEGQCSPEQKQVAKCGPKLQGHELVVCIEGHWAVVGPCIELPSKPLIPKPRKPKPE